jgi:RHS repeat-associated protein
LSIVQDFDKMDRLASKTLPQVSSEVDVGRTVTYTYAGPLLTQVSEVGTGLSRTDYLKYDEARRLRKKDSPEGVLTYEYNARGQVSRTRGFRRGLVSVDAEVGTATADVDVEYGYDPLGRLATTKNNKVSGADVSTNYYDVVGNLAQTSYPNKVRHFWEYTEQNRLKSTRVEKFESGTVTLHRRYDYALGVAGHRKQVIEKLANDVTRRNVTYRYDYAESPPLVGVLGTGASLQELRPPLAKVYRLTEEKLISDTAGPKATYQHDLVGNRLGRTDTGLGTGSDQSYVYAANDRVTSDTTAEFTYDANGNTVTSGTGTVTDYYDAENRLVKRAAPSNLAITMGYDTSGNRVWKHVNNNGAHKTTYYLVDDQNPTGYAQVLLETEDTAASPTPSAATFHERYEYGLRLISIADASNTYYVGCDGQNSVRMLLDSGGNVLANSELDYDAYGNQLSANNLTFDLRYRYDGEQWDSDLGMYYLRARYYSSKLGRFWSADSFEGRRDDPLSLHRYIYCASDPVNHIDPSGHEYNLTSLNASIATGLRITAQVGVRAGRVLTRARQFFWNSRRFQAVSRAYWRANGPANGRSLHHWLLPQRWNFIPQGLRNAGFNLLELPKVLPGNLGLNQWMGFAVRWGGYRAVLAYTVENGIRILIPLSIYEAANVGSDNEADIAEPVYEPIQLTPADWENDEGFEELRHLEDDEEMDGAPFTSPILN